MDLSSVLSPGLQNLVAAMLGEAWSATRDALARRLGHGDAARISGTERELDSVRTEVQALMKGSTGTPDSEAERRRLLEVYVAGYLRRVREEHPDVDEVVASLPAVVTASGGSTVTTGSGRTQVFHGNVGSVISVEQLDGGITLTNNG